MRNRIYQGVSEGIFVMLCGKIAMYNNDIYHNYDGIVVMEACPDISFNRIKDNKSIGVMLLRFPWANVDKKKLRRDVNAQTRN